MCDFSGFKYVFNCQQCGNDYGAYRSSSSFCSKSCMDRRRYENNKESMLARSRIYRKENRSALREKIKNYCDENKDVIRERNKKFYEANRDYALERMRNYREQNPGRFEQYRVNSKIKKSDALRIDAMMQLRQKPIIESKDSTDD